MNSFTYTMPGFERGVTSLYSYSGTGEYIASDEVVAEIKEIDGIRHWVIYSMTGIF